jgi:hypothetical protein
VPQVYILCVFLAYSGNAEHECFDLAIRVKLGGKLGIPFNMLLEILLDGKTTTQAVMKIILMYNQSVLFSTNQSSRSLL